MNGSAPVILPDKLSSWVPAKEASIKPDASDAEEDLEDYPQHADVAQNLFLHHQHAKREDRYCVKD